MFKLGRGGGRGGNAKRPLHHPPPSHGTRPVGASSARSLGGGSSVNSSGRGRGSSGPASGAGAQATEESFSLVLGKLLSFGAIIRLAPDLVEEIRKAEARGASVKIKFDANSNDPSGNVVDVDGKEFRFTWSRDFGDLCDIYEECANGEDGNGLLVERGSAWRKLNVQRVLDESIKNHVKMISEEAERRKESRKAIVLDLANPSVKNQSSAAVEGNMKRTLWKRKKEPPYKNSRAEPTKVLNLGASTFKPVSSTKQSVRRRNSVSPQRSPLEKPGHGSSLSPYGAENSSKHPATSDGFNPITSNKGDPVNYLESEKNLLEIPRKEAFDKAKDAASAKPLDLRSLLVSILSENPKGMSFKAIEKAVTETMPDASKKFEAVLKNVAKIISPGRYVLKSGVSLDSSWRQQSESGSSPESTKQVAQEALAVEPMNKIIREEMEPSSSKFSVAEEVLDILDKTDKPEMSPDHLTKDRQVNNDSEGRSSSSSGSGSDSDSESESSDSGSDSGSQSRSRSKTRSPADSASASSSDSESDGSSSSKETDIDVDITSSGDEKVEIKISPSSEPWQSHDGPYSKGSHEVLDDDLAPLNYNPPNMLEGGGDVVQMAENTNTKIDNIIESLEIAECETENNDNINEELRPLPLGPLKEIDRQANFGGGPESCTLASINLSSNEKLQLSKNVSSNDRINNAERIPKSNSKWSSEGKHHEMTVNLSKSIKGSSSSENSSHRREADLSGPVSRAPRKSEENLDKELKKLENRSIPSEDYIAHESEKGSVSAGSTAYRNVNRKRQSPDFLDVSQLDAQESSRRYSDTNIRRKPFNREKSGRSGDSSDPSTNDDERTSHPQESDVQVSNRLSMKEKNLVSSGRKQRDIVNENSENGGRYPKVSDPYNMKIDEHRRIPKDDGKSSTLLKTNTGNLSATGIKGPSLKRELSDLEVGELREPISIEDTQLSKRQLDRKGSFKASKTKINESGGSHSEAAKGKSAADVNQELIRQSPVLDSRIRNSQDGLSRKGSEESAKPQMRPPSQLQQRLRMDQTDSEINHFGRIQDSAWTDESKETSWKKELLNKEAASNGDRNMDASNGDRNMESPEEDVSFFSKFEKNEPELRGPIKDFDQYKDYVEEYTEKYKCYYALNEQIEKIRTAFLKIGGDFPELAKGKDRKAFDDCCHRILKFHRQHMKMAPRVKKTFVVLHQELETLKRRIKDFAEEYTRE